MEKKIKIKFQNSDPSAVPTEATLVFDSLNELPSDPAELADGLYMLQVVGGEVTIVANPIPDPSQLADGDYKLVMLGGVPTWTLIV